MTFAEKVETLTRTLASGGISHALGGALALAYCTEEPRATGDIDVNVFVAPKNAQEVFAALPEGVLVRDTDREMASRDGQVRLWWGETAVDLFFAYHAFHEEASGRTREVPFGDVPVRVIDCTDLAVFKAVFGRSRDWADIEAMADAGSLDIGRAMRCVADLLGSEDEAYQRLAQALVPRAGPDEREVYRRAFGSPSDRGD